MAIVKCKECGHEISTKAEACPQCGAKRKPSSMGCGGLIVVIFLAFVILTTIGIVVGPGDQPSGAVRSTSPAVVLTKYAHETVNIRQAQSADSPAVGRLVRGDAVQFGSVSGEWGRLIDGRGFVYLPVLENEPVPAFEIVSSSWVRDPDFGGSGSVIYNVELRNNTSRYVENVRVEITTYDANGSIMTTDFTFVKGLAPGGTGSAKGYATYFGGEETARIRVVR